MDKKIILLSFAGFIVLLLYLFLFKNTEINILNSISFLLLMGFLVIININFKLGVLYFLITRNLADAFRDETLFFNVDGSNFASLITIFFIVFSITKIIGSKTKLFQIKQFRPFTIFLLAVIPSVLLSFDKMTSIIDYLRFVGLFVFFAVIFLFFNKTEDIKHVVYAVLFSLIVPLSVATYQLITGNGIYDAGFLRVYGTYLHSNGFAFYLMTVGLFLASDIFGKTKIFKKPISITLFCILCIFLVLTYTRSAWIAFMFGLMVLLFFLKKPLIPILLIGIIILILFVPSISYRFNDLSAETDATGRLNSWAWRTMVWRDTVSLAIKNPILGLGLGTYAVSNKFYAHNDYLRIFFESGILGLFFYVTLLVSILRRSFYQYHNSLDIFTRQVSLAVFSIGTSYFLVSFSDNLSCMSAVLIYYFALVAISYRMFLKEKT